MKHWALLFCLLCACGDDSDVVDAGADVSADTSSDPVTDASGNDVGRDANASDSSLDTEGDAGPDDAPPDTSIDTRDFEDLPLSASITRVQPMTGIVLWENAWNSDPIKTSDSVSLEFAYVAPSSIALAQGAYDWSAFDAMLDRIAAREHQAVIRFYYTYPGDETRVPDFIKAIDGYNEVVGTTEGQRTMFPDWSHPALRDFHLEFFRRFAARYDSDPRIAFLQVGFGLWGEYHIYDGPFELGQTFPPKAFQAEFIREMNGLFSELHWSISIDAASESYSPFSEDASLTSGRFGLFDDSFMHENHSGYNETSWNFFGHTTRYERVPHGGELSYYNSFDQRNALNVGGIHGRTYEQLSARFHISYMIGNDQPSYQTDTRIRDAGMANGYRFRITSLRSNGAQTEVSVENTGIAPIYYNAFVSVGGVRSRDSLMGLLPGQRLTTLINGTGDLRIDCDRLVPGQTIEFEASLP